MILYKSLKGKNANGKTPLTGLKNGGDPKQPVRVPCSRCFGCRLERSRQNAIRCVNEAQMHENNCFITLTYSDEYLTWGSKKPVLYPRDLQLFFKRLRKKYGPKIRFFACGEYGERKGRPHYHACVFNHAFTDLTPKPNTQGDSPLFDSESLKALWGLGDVSVGEVTFESAAYVARYIMQKKLGKTASFYKREGISPEFVRMSRRPGIGASWYEKFKDDIFPHDYQVIRGGMKIRPPKYYGSKYELTNPTEYAIISESRQKAAEKMAPDNTLKRLAVKERVKKRQVSSLSR